MTTLLLTFALLATVPQDTVLRDRVDCLEVNAFHDAEGELVFTQLLFLDWCNRKGCHRCADWRLLKQSKTDERYGSFHITIRRDYATGEWVARWWEDSGGSREVRAVTYRETVTQYDPELKDRDAHPVNERRKLIQGGKP